MKGLTKAIMRTPQMLSSKVGMAKKSSDPEFDEYNRHFTEMEGCTEQLLKDSKVFTEAVTTLLQSGHQFATHFSNIFSPFATEHNLEVKHPDAALTIRNVDLYQKDMEELRMVLAPELELIDNRIVGPVKELQGIMKLIRKNITKRDHKLIDFDRYNNSLSKLREKKEKSLSDEKNLFKLEQDFEQASTEYETYNTALKTDLPTFMRLATQFIDPLFHSFYYMQLNIYYLMFEKLTTFCEKKYDTSGTTQDIVNTYEERRGDAREQIEALSITKRMISAARTLQQQRLASGGSLTPGSSGLGRSVSSASTGTTGSGSLGMNRSNTVASSAGAGKFASLASKKAPPPPPSAMASHAAPPPYTPASSASVVAKKAPPPPPVKPKPAPAAKPVVLVTALYDFDAQADGDLSFKAGDRIEIIQRSDSAEDWWTGKLNGQQGVFPGNYVQE